MRRLLLLVTLVLLAGGCAQKNSRVLDIEAHNEKSVAKAVTYPADLRGAYFVDETKGMKYCAEPAPDVARNFIKEFNAALQANVPTKGSVNATVAATLQNTALELAGRSELVLLSREMLYRLCELSNNAKLENVDAKSLYESAMETIVNLSESEFIRQIGNTGLVDNVDNETKKDAANMLQKLIDKKNKEN